MMKNDTLNMLIGLNNQGVQLFITEDGWKVFLHMMSEVENEFVTEGSIEEMVSE